MTRSRAQAFNPGPARPRIQSYTRLVLPTRAPLPSTVPPPPFTRETDVTGIEWWLDAHMRAASSLLCLERAVHAASGEDERRRIEATLAPLGAVRDALYSLYCDASDPRMAALVDEGGVLTVYVRAIYAWLDDVTGCLRGALRGETSEAATQIDEATNAAAGQLDAALAMLDIDDASPVDPLRNLRADLAETFTVIARASARAAIPV
jgi:hypothetical protein